MNSLSAGTRGNCRALKLLLQAPETGSAGTSRVEQELEGFFMSELRPIQGFDRYAASADGRIWSYIRGRFLKGSPDSCGYLLVGLRRDGKTFTRLVHRLVCHAWNGDPPTPKHEANHMDLCKTNNAKSNLEWTTHQENVAHAMENLPPETIERIRAGLKKGWAVGGARKPSA